MLNRWLAIVLTPMLLWAILPFLAPIAMKVGWSELGTLIYTLYLPFCHQLPQRSWFFFGAKFTYTLAEIEQVYPHTEPFQLRFFYGTPEIGWRVAWSDRMISFYMMIPIFGLLYAWLRKRRRIEPLALILLAVLIAPLILDGGTHMVNDLLYGVSGKGFRDTNEWLALPTGNAWPRFYAGDHFGTFNWWMRIVTGVLAAWGLAFWVFPLIDKEIQ